MGSLRTWSSPDPRGPSDSWRLKVSPRADATGDGGGLEDDDSPGPEVRACLEGRALLALL